MLRECEDNHDNELYIEHINHDNDTNTNDNEQE